MSSKSPFFIVDGFLSPKLCEHITDVVDLRFPNLNVNNKPIKTTKKHQRCETIILDRFESIHNSVMSYFSTEYYGVTDVTFELYSAGYSESTASCDNSNLVRGKWSRVHDVDFTCVVFFTDYNNEDVDDSIEVYGGKYEFPTHGFGFNPKRGMLLVYPSGPNFINGISPVYAGNLSIAKFFLKTSKMYIYDQSNFQGNYKDWYS